MTSHAPASVAVHTVALIALSLIFLIPTLLGAQEPQADAAARQVISVTDFMDNTGIEELAWLRAGLSDMLLSDLARAGLTVVNRDDVNAALEEQALALSGLTDDTALEIGRMVMADRILTGAYAVSGESLRIDVRVIGVDSGAVTATATATGSVSGVFSLETGLARDICIALGVETPVNLGQSGTRSVPAARAYYEGLVLHDSGDIDAARGRFQEAARLDPLYARPRYSLEESWQLLNDFRALRHQREVNTLWRKAEALIARLAAEPFITDSDAILAAYTGGSPTVKTGSPPADDPTLGSCPSPAVCLWNLQITYWEIGSKSAEYFDDTVTEKATLREVAELARQAEETWPDDEWLPEILYWEVFAYRWLGEWEDVRSGCERIFVEWPDFRMSWALEDMYELALTELRNR